MRALSGLLRPVRGTIAFTGHDLAAAPAHAVARAGLVLVPEGRGIFGPMTVEENLLLGGYLGRDAIAIKQRRERVFALFPRLAERLRQVAGSMSGGEQQMLAIGRALMAGPRLLMLDEPSLGLAPRLAAEILAALGLLNREGLGILLVEQKAPLALRLAKRVYVLSVGRVVAETTPDRLATRADLARLYLA